MHLKISSAQWQPFCLGLNVYVGWLHVCEVIKDLTHWGRVTYIYIYIHCIYIYICVRKLTTIGSDNGLSPDRRQAIIWTSAGILLIGPLGTNFSEILIGIQTFSFTKIHLKMPSAKWRPFCLGLDVLTFLGCETHIYELGNHMNCFISSKCGNRLWFHCSLESRRMMIYWWN